ncbi:hypothetical protein ACFYN3_12530 [Streptomyces lavendulae]|uniref:hypothetical protein n=1 Tax=Streptomyces lavendulae TaxID=1914 RepID=UPI0036C77833
MATYRMNIGGSRKDYESRMETVGWAAAGVAVLGGIGLVLGHALDQIPGLSEKAEKAIKALRRLRAAWRGDEEQGKPDREDETDREGNRPR